jgi:hypothetical protein
MKIYNRKYLIGSLLMAVAFTISFAAGSKTKHSQSTAKVKKDTVSSKYALQPISSMPEYDSKIKEPLQIDLRYKDLSNMDLEVNIDELKLSNFSTATKWPSNLPEGFNPNKIIELGKNPGLGVRKLHEKGVTGKSVGVAIIDSAILKEHIEYKDSLKLYKQVHSLDLTPSMHGAAVASVACGNNVGVAPDADLYYINTNYYNIASKSGNMETDFSWFAQAVDEVLEINKTLEADKKIRVIAAAVGASPKDKGYEDFVSAVERAKKDNIFLITSSLKDTYRFCFQGLGRSSLDNPDNVDFYRPGAFWSNAFYNGIYSPENLVRLYDSYINEVLFFPMDVRTTASELDNDVYSFYNVADWSFVIPYIAGLYALSCQVDPQTTPEKFWQKAVETGDTVKFDKDGKFYEMKKIVNPLKLIDAIKYSE